MGFAEVEQFWGWLASERKVSVATHKQALLAPLFFYGKGLGIELPWLIEIGKPQVRHRLPVVLSANEITRILYLLEGEHRLFAQQLYGTGMRLTEGLRLRVKDVDFSHNAIIVRQGKGVKNHAVMLPQRLAPSLNEQLAPARVLWESDQAAGKGGTEMPYALERK